MSLNIVTLERLLTLHRQRENSFVLVTGCFDILHAGHVQLLEYAFRVCHVVWVGLNSDRAVRQLKGEGRPVNPYAHRAKVMAAVRYVKYVFEIDDIRVTDTILTLSPTYWVKGGDYTMETLDQAEVAAARQVGAEIILFRSDYDVSTTRILNKSQ